MPRPRQPTTRETEFNLWVGRQLAHWPTRLILEFERWLLEEGDAEFLPAVRAALWERTLEEAQTVTG
jgi:hypothetical protein